MRSGLWSALKPYRRRHSAARWLGPETWHLTLLFLGSVDVVRVAELADLVDRAARSQTPFRASIEGGDGRVRRDDAVAWLAIEEGAGEVIGLADRLHESCPPDVVRGKAPRRTPSAHVTVARRADADLVGALEEQRHGSLAATWWVDRLALVRSHLERLGARYETLHEATMYAAG